jgi:hypothetical protein
MKRQGNMVTDTHPLHPLTYRYHFSRAIRARHEIRFAQLLVSPGEDYQVTKIQRSGPQPHQHLTRCRRWRRVGFTKA